jgi:glycosyltransferase involved in cell wall biosynthesis
VHVLAGAFGRGDSADVSVNGVTVHYVGADDFIESSSGRINFGELEHQIARRAAALPIPNLIHAHHWVANLTIAQRRPMTVPVATNHGHINSIPLFAASAISNRREREFRRFVAKKEIELFRLVAAIACVSDALRKELAAGSPDLCAKATVVVNPIGDVWWECSQPRVDAALLCLYVGRASQEKGLQICIDAFRLMLEHDDTAHLLLVIPYGQFDAARGYVTADERNFDLRGLGAAVSVRVGADHAEVLDLMRARNVLLHPSYCESSGLAVLEALACGLHVVARDMQAMREIKSTVGDGLRLIGDDDHVLWATAAEEIVASKAGEGLTSGRRALRAKHGMSCCREQYDMFYREARHGRHGGLRHASVARESPASVSRRGVIMVTEEDGDTLLGGIGTWISAFVGEAAARDDLFVTIFRCRWEYQSVTCDYRNDSIAVVNWPMLHDLEGVFAVMEEIAGHANKFMAVHLHRHILAPLASKLSALLGAPLVYTAHSLIRAECRNYPFGRRAWLAQLDVIARADVVVVPSPGERSLLLEYAEGRSIRSIEIIPNGMAFDGWNATSGINREFDATAPIQVLYAGRFVPHKGVHTLVEAFHAAVALGARLELNLIGAGHGDQQYEQLLRRLIEGGAGADRIFVRDWTPGDPMACTRSAGRVVFCSLGTYEPFGYMYLDALKAGIPCLISRTNGSALIFGESYPYVEFGDG